MKTIDLALAPTEGYLNSFTRNTVEGWWELEIGLPKTWVFDETDKIGCEILMENEVGKLINIVPKKQGIVIDDLVEFVEIIIQTNKRISEKEKQFTDKMQEMKGMLENEAKKFYEELDELKARSFKSFNDEPSKKPRKPRKPKTVESVSVKTEDIEELDKE